MIVLRQVIGDELRRRRQDQGREPHENLFRSHRLSSCGAGSGGPPLRSALVVSVTPVVRVDESWKTLPVRRPLRRFLTRAGSLGGLGGCEAIGLAAVAAGRRKRGLG